MEIRFSNEYTELVLEIRENKIFMRGLFCAGKPYAYTEQSLPHSFVFLIGEPYLGKNFSRYTREGEKFSYVGHKQVCVDGKKELIIEERNEKLSVRTIYSLFDDCGVLECRKEIVNVSEEEYDIECASSLIVQGVLPEAMFNKADNASNVRADMEEIAVGGGNIVSAREKLVRLPYLWKGYNSWCAENSFERVDLRLEGLRGLGRIKKCGKITVSSNGTQTTCRYLPMGILEKENFGLLAFEIVPEGSWTYEIEAGARLDVDQNDVFLALTGKTYAENAWYKTLRPNEKYTTETVRVFGGKDMDEIVGELTKIRRKTRKRHKIKVHEKIIYNNFEQNTFGDANEKADEIYIPYAAKYGCDYYVTDAGWHDEGIEHSATHEFGLWQENPNTYPSGLIKSVERAEKYGMKYGLWVELQGIGMYCKDKNILPEECFFHIHGHRPQGNLRWQLDYSKKQVRDYADGIVQMLVEKYNPGYIKIDYNQTQLGNDCKDGSPAEGMSMHDRAYNAWFDEIQSKHPNVVFESCASGGMRNDGNTVRLAPVVSISDQGRFYNYPFMLANVGLSLLPEQSGIWNMPVRLSSYPHTTDEEVIMNVVNSLYGVMHLSSKLDGLTETQEALLQEGVAYYKQIAPIKDKALPVMPNGITLFDDETVCVALKHEKKLYLSLYNMSAETRTVEQNLSKYGVKEATLVYPRQADNQYALSNGVLVCQMTGVTARAFELDLE